MSDYSNTLNLYKQLQKSGAEHVDANLSTPTVIGSTVEALDEAVYGAYEDENQGSPNGNDILLETMKEVESGNLSEKNRERIEENVKNSKMPTAILQDMLNNPLIYTKVGKDDVDTFVENTLKSSAGIQKSSKIIEQVEKVDKKKLEEKRVSQPQTYNVPTAQVDYNKISEIVENIVDSKLAEYGQRMRLNENKSMPFNGVKVLQLKENGTFLMLDTDDNIYECTLKYKGKNKKKR